MNTPRMIEGQWWIYGDDKPAYFGVLFFDPERGLELNVKIPQARTGGDGFLEMLNSTTEVVTEIHGLDKSNLPITLFGCGDWQWTKGLGLDSYQIHGQVAILNYHGFAWSEANFQIAQVDYTLLTKWMNRRLGIKSVKDESQPEGGSIRIKFQSNEELEFELNSGVRFRLEGNTLREAGSTEFRLAWHHSVWFIFPESLSAEKSFRDYASVFLRLLCLLTGERVFIERLVFWNADPFEPNGKVACGSHEFLTTNRNITQAERNTHALNMIARYDEVAASLPSVVKTWFACHERLKPVLDLHFAIVANLVLTDESRFLLLAQALEVYHARCGRFSSVDFSEEAHNERVEAILSGTPEKFRRWLGFKLKNANQKMLSQRLDDVFDSHSDEFLRLTARIPDFAAKVRESRNYYTHYGEKTLCSGKVAQGLELRRIVHALSDLLDICFLKELGITGKPIERIVERNESMEWADLEAQATLGKREPNGEQSPQRSAALD